MPFTRARERGELPAGTDIEQAVDEVVGPVYYRALVAGRPLPAEFTDALARRWLSRRPEAG